MNATSPSSTSPSKTYLFTTWEEAAAAPRHDVRRVVFDVGVEQCCLFANLDVGRFVTTFPNATHIDTAVVFDLPPTELQAFERFPYTPVRLAFCQWGLPNIFVGQQPAIFGLLFARRFGRWDDANLLQRLQSFSADTLRSCPLASPPRWLLGSDSSGGDDATTNLISLWDCARVLGLYCAVDYLTHVNHTSPQAGSTPTSVVRLLANAYKTMRDNTASAELATLDRMVDMVVATTNHAVTDDDARLQKILSEANVGVDTLPTLTANSTPQCPVLDPVADVALRGCNLARELLHYEQRLLSLASGRKLVGLCKAVLFVASLRQRS